VNQADDKFCGGCAHPLRVAVRAAGSSPGIRVQPVTQAAANHSSTMPISLDDLLPVAPLS